MIEEKKYLSLLQVTVPPATALTVTAQVKIMEILGIISNPDLVKSADIAVGMIPNDTPATLHGLMILLNNLVKNHPKSTKAHHDKLAEVMKDVGKLPDAALTFGDFLPICSAVMNAIEKEKNKKKVQAHRPVKKAAAKK